MPVKEGEKHRVTIFGEGSKGDGMAKIMGLIIFIPGAKTGETHWVKIRKVAARAAFADIVPEEEAV